jgi:hypothetical protein
MSKKYKENKLAKNVLGTFDHSFAKYSRPTTIAMLAGLFLLIVGVSSAVIIHTRQVADKHTAHSTTISTKQPKATQAPTAPAQPSTAPKSTPTSSSSVSNQSVPALATKDCNYYQVGFGSILSNRESELAGEYDALNKVPSTQIELAQENFDIEVMNGGLGLQGAYTTYSTAMQLEGCALITPSPTAYPLIIDPGNLPQN